MTRLTPLNERPFTTLRPDERGKFDELLAVGVHVHMEMLDDKTLWIGLDKGRRHARVVISANGPLRILVEDPG